MEFHDLSTVSVNDLTDAFNAAFADYFFPIHLNVHQLADKIRGENIRLNHSVGISVDKKLIAFILIGIEAQPEHLIFYNAGTGVLPEFRGRQLTQKMYAHLFGSLEKQSGTYVLEVITKNENALHIYKKLGYEISRTVSCFRGKVVVPTCTCTFETRPFDPSDETFSRFWNHKPTYQNTLATIKRNAHLHEALGIFDDGKLMGYIIYVKNSGRVKQFGVHPNHRRKGIGQQLFCEVRRRNPDQDIFIINSDNSDAGTQAFLVSIGLSVFLEQFEMVLYY